MNAVITILSIFLVGWNCKNKFKYRKRQSKKLFWIPFIIIIFMTIFFYFTAYLAYIMNASTLVSCNIFLLMLMHGYGIYKDTIATEKEEK